MLSRTIASILAGDTLPAEIVVADQSTGEVEGLPDDDRVEMVHLMLDTTGCSRARNTANDVATHEVRVVVDDDVDVERDWLRRIAEPLLGDDDRLVVTGAVLAPRDVEIAGHIPSLTDRTEPETFSGRLYGDVLSGNNFAIQRQAFEEIGGYDERLGPGARFASSDDNDLGYKLLEAGYRIEFVPDAIVYHLGVRRGREILRLHWIYGRGQGAFYAKHMSLSDRFMMRRFWRNAGFRLRRIARLLRGERQGLREAVYLAGMVSGASGWWLRYGRKR